jgi:pimeloyl-ACP methyl ester carboxylesterase
MAAFILVHGTFAQSAHWPILQDRLAETTRAAGDEPLFEQLLWTGRNRARARQSAASAIFTMVQRFQRTLANEKIFIIGHSHGGSAIAYFLKEHPEVAKTLAGCAFLSTPFVAIRARREATRLMGVLMFFPYIVTWRLWFESASPDYFHYFQFVVLLVTFFLASLFLARASSPQNVEQSVRQQTADIPAGNYLFLRCSGDEAAAALSAAQIIAWLGTKVSQILDLLTRPFFDLITSELTWRRFLIQGSLIVFVLGSFGYGLLIVLPAVVKTGFANLLSPDGLFLENLDFEGMIFHILRIVYTLVSFVMAVLMLLCLSAVFLIFLTQALTSWTFGWTRFFTGFLVELAIEPLPFGEHSLIHIDWAAESTGLDGLVHSWTYAHPVAILHLQKWVSASLEKLPMTAAEPATKA